jgi:hypothetical protein
MFLTSNQLNFFETMVIYNYIELNNMILANYVDITLEHVLLKIKNKVNVYSYKDLTTKH